MINKFDTLTIFQRLITFLLSSFLLAGPLFAIESPEPEDQTRSKKILDIVDDLWRGKSSYAKTTMRVKTAHYTRTMQMEGWSKGKEKTLFRILEPLREKGTITLKSGNHIFTYLPKTDRTIRLTSGMMMGSWMGSHITNDDLVKEARYADDYHAKISFEGIREGQQVIEFTLIPKEDAAVVWGKILLTIEADGYNPVIEYYYDEDMQLARTFSFNQKKMLGGRLRPSVMRVVPADQPEEFTEFIYKELQFDIKISDRLFSKSSLKKR
jgi:hypothetical protein